MKQLQRQGPKGGGQGYGDGGRQPAPQPRTPFAGWGFGVHICRRLICRRPHGLLLPGDAAPHQRLLQGAGAHQQACGGGHRQLEAHVLEPIGPHQQHHDGGHDQPGQGPAAAAEFQRHQGDGPGEHRPHHRGLGTGQQQKQTDRQGRQR